MQQYFLEYFWIVVDNPYFILIWNECQKKLGSVIPSGSLQLVNFSDSCSETLMFLMRGCGIALFVEKTLWTKDLVQTQPLHISSKPEFWLNQLWIDNWNVINFYFYASYWELRHSFYNINFPNIIKYFHQCTKIN